MARTGEHQSLERRAPAPRRVAQHSTSSRVQGDKAKGKRVATQTKPVENESGTESESDEPVLKEKRVPSKKPKVPTYAEYYKKLMNADFRGTKYPDHMLLEDLGLQEEVRLLFRNMKLEKFMDMAFPAYQIATCQFLASLSMTPYRFGRLSQEYELGFIEFRVDKKHYKMTFTELCGLFGFPEDGVAAHFSFKPRELDSLWKTIAQGIFKPGESKAALIRNPALRYAHKVLAHTIFARRETGQVLEEELGFLDNGLAPLSYTCSNGIALQGDQQIPNLAAFLVRHLLRYKDWVCTTKDKTPQLSVGGIITPILEACGIVPGSVKDGTKDGIEAGIERIDAYYLSRSRFLGGRIGSSYAYKFEPTPKNLVRIMLPNRALTALQDLSNIAFSPPAAQLYNPAIHPALQAIRKPGTNESEPPQEQERDEAQGTLSSVYGSERYTFQPYAEPLPDVASRAAHQQIKLLQRWNKWQDRTIKKLVKTVKGMKSQIKELKEKIAGSSSSHTHELPLEHEESDENNVDERRRHSFQGTEGEPVQQDQPRSSSYERRRRKRRAVRSPTPCSSNMSYSMDTSTSVEF